MCKILPRIKQIALAEGITIGALERRIGASKGVLSRAIANGTDIQAKWLEAIVENYPHYSAQWLLTGVGEMLRPQSSCQTEEAYTANPTIESEMPSTRLDPVIERFMCKITEQAEEIGRLKARIEELEREESVPTVHQYVHSTSKETVEP